MFKSTIRFILPVLSAMAMTGCEISKEKGGILTVGMEMTHVTKELRRVRIELAPEEGAYVAPHERPSHRFVIETTLSNDTIFLLFEQNANETYYFLETMYFYRDWKLDSKMAVKERKSNTEDFNTISVKELKEWTKRGLWPVK